MSNKVSVKEKKRVSQSSILCVVDEKGNKINPNSIMNQSQTNLVNLLDNIHIRNLESNNGKDDAQVLFKKRIDKLNLKFYLETEKYLSNKHDNAKSQDNLFIILFKQISLYIEELERINKQLREKNENEKSAKERIEELDLLEKEKVENQQMIFTYKAKVNLLEKKLNEKSQIEEKMKKEIESLRRQITFYQDKIKVDISASHKAIVVNKKTSGGMAGYSGAAKSSNAVSNNQAAGKTKTCVSPMFNNPQQENEELNSSVIINNTNDTSTLQKRIANKKRSVSDNNPTPSGNNLNSTTSTLMIKRRYENNNNMEVNNINITLNMHVKNSNNTNINVGGILNRNLDKREITKSSNATNKQTGNTYNKPGEIKSPVRTKSTLTEKYKKQGSLTSSHHKTASTHLPETVVNSAIKNKPQKFKTDLANSTRTKDETKLNVSFSNNISFDLNSIQDAIVSTYKNYQEELIELEELEKLLKLTKCEFNNQFEDSGYPFSDADCEDFSRVDFKGSSFGNSVNSSLVNSPVTNPVSLRKNNNNHIFNSVTIDLNSNTNQGHLLSVPDHKIKQTLNSIISPPQSNSKEYKIKVNKKRSDSNKSDNPNQTKVKTKK